jgi:hypothetical protein
MASASGSRDPVIANPSTGGGLDAAAARESFFTARERHRRAAALYGTLAAAAVGVTGLPLGIAVTPLLYLMILPVATAMSIAYPKAVLWGAIRYMVPLLIPFIAMIALTPLDYAYDKGRYTFHGERHFEPLVFDFANDSSHKRPPSAADTKSHGTPRTGEAPGAAPSAASDPFDNDPNVHRGTMPGLVPALALVAILLVPPGSLVLLLTWGLVRRVFRRSGVGGILLALGARVPDSTDLTERDSSTSWPRWRWPRV